MDFINKSIIPLSIIICIIVFITSGYAIFRHLSGANQLDYSQLEKGVSNKIKVDINKTKVGTTSREKVKKNKAEVKVPPKPEYHSKPVVKKKARIQPQKSPVMPVRRKKGQSSMEGKVLDNIARDPVVNANVDLFISERGHSKKLTWVQTDNEGKFEIKELPDNSVYWIMVSKNNVGSEVVSNIEMKAKEAKKDLGNIIIKQNNTVEGNVTSSTGELLPDVVISFRLRIALKGNRSGAYEGIRTVRTDKDGNYTCAGLPEGAYQVSVKKQGYRTVNLPLHIRKSGTTPPFNIRLISYSSSKKESNINRPQRQPNKKREAKTPPHSPTPNHPIRRR